MNGGRDLLAIAATIGLACLAATSVSLASPDVDAPEARLARAQSIRAELNTQARLVPRPAFTIRESTTMYPLESLTLLTEDLFERRFVSAERGIWYGMCPLEGICPSPAPRLARPAADVLPRRLALELAVRTFLATDAEVVAVSLPTPRTVAFVITREELVNEVDLRTLLAALRAEQVPETSSVLRKVVNELTLARTFLFVGFEPGPNGGLSWAGMPRWPIVHP
ncbi:MAG TPA: hypothetical protein VK926_10295 [Gaiellaceae bacterium]|nr:hypothetical protein [Gaiellaceae bacterium]